MLARIIIAAVLLIVLHFVPITGIPRFICYLAVYLVIGYDNCKKAFKGIKNGQVSMKLFDGHCNNRCICAGSL